MLAAIAFLVVPLPAKAAGVWTDLAPVNIARQEVAATVLDGRIYLIGGLEDDGGATIEEYDPAMNRWTVIATLPGILHHTAAVTLDGSIYIIGGYDNLAFRPTSAFRRFDPITRVFETLTPLPSPSGAHTAGVIGGRIYVAGGAEVPSRLLSYDPSSGIWTHLPSMPTPREHVASAVIDDRLFVVGGRLAGVITNALESYDPETNQWTTHAPMPTARGGLAAATVFGRLYVFGGEGNRAVATGTFAETESFDPVTGQWQAEPNMPLPRHGIAAVTLGRRIHIPAGAPIEGISTTTHHDAFVPQPPRRLRPVRVAEESNPLPPSKRDAYPRQPCCTSACRMSSRRLESPATNVAGDWRPGHLPFAQSSSSSAC